MIDKRCAHGWLNHADCEVCTLLAERDSMQKQLASRDVEIKGLEASLDLAKHERNNLEETVTKQDAEVATLREQGKIARVYLERLESLGNGDRYGNSSKNCLVIEALAATEELK